MPSSVEQIIQGLEETHPVGQYLYRGQSMIYPGASSTLARILPEERGDGLLTFLEAKNLLGAVSLYPPHTLDIEIMADLRHFGGLTNFIDFTRDPRIALFFACLGHEDEPGQVLCLRIDRGNLSYPWDYSLSSLYDLHRADILRIFQDFHIASNAKRAVRQSSVMIHQPSGYLKFAKEDAYCIPAARKPEIREYLASQPPNIKPHYLFPNKADFIELSRKSPEPNEDFEKNLDAWLDNRSERLKGAGYYGQGKEHFFYGSYGKAAGLFQAALRMVGRSNLGIDFYRFLSSSLLHTKQYRDALGEIAKIPRTNWTDKEHYMAALGEQGRKDFSGALVDIKQAITSNPSRALYYIKELKIMKQAEKDDALHWSKQRSYEKLFHNIRGEDSPLGQDDF